jgi:hypothetical protein
MVGDTRGGEMRRILPLAGRGIAHAITQLPEPGFQRATRLTDVDKPKPISASDAVNPRLARRNRRPCCRCVLN